MSNSLSLYNNNSLAEAAVRAIELVAEGSIQISGTSGRDGNGHAYQTITITPTQYCSNCGYAYYNPSDSVRNNPHDLEFSLTCPIMFSRCAPVVVADENNEDMVVGSNGVFAWSVRPE
jgi:hypothetical protein